MRPVLRPHSLFISSSYTQKNEFTPYTYDVYDSTPGDLIVFCTTKNALLNRISVFALNRPCKCSYRVQ